MAELCCAIFFTGAFPANISHNNNSGNKSGLCLPLFAARYRRRKQNATHTHAQKVSQMLKTLLYVCVYVRI